jgi:alkylation response protein AidB-like acyl-CoA dehydrogenase
MSYQYSNQELAFAAEAREYVRANLDPKVKRKILSSQLPMRKEREVWQKCLAKRGWGAPSWPVEHGGTGWSVVQRHLFDEILSEEGAPGYPVFGMTMLAPVLMKFGTQQQKDEILPAILNMDNFWCQGFSESEAGSDLASLKARARLEGDQWVINGQKIWTTLAHEADKMFLLVRTSDAAKKQEGLSILLLDMDTPGITVRPIITIDGHHEVNEVFFDNVRVSADSIIGDEGQGWTYAKYLLGHERTSIARIGQSRRELKRLKATAAQVPWRDQMVVDAAWFKRRHAAIEIRHRVLEATTLRVLGKVAAETGAASGANLLKIHGSEIQMDLAELWMDVVGEYSFAYAQSGTPAAAHLGEVAPWEADYVSGAYFNSRKVAIYGGSNEIQRNIIAKAELGL